MSINYKGIELNSPGDSAPWGLKEQDAFKATIDSIVIDTVSGSASDAKVNGHKHFKLYSETNGDLVLSIDAAQKTTMIGDVQIDGNIQATVAVQEGFVKNDAAGNLSFGNEGGGSNPLTSFLYRFSTSTTGNVPTGRLRYNNADPALVTLVVADQETNDGKNVLDILLLYTEGKLAVFDPDDAGVRHIYNIVSVAQNGDDVEYTVTYNSSTTGLWTNLQSVTLVLSQDSGGGGTTVPGGVDTNVQYNGAGSFAGSNRFVYDGNNLTLRDAGLNSTINFASDISQMRVNDNSGNNIVVSPIDCISNNSYTFRPNTPSNTMFFDGFVDDMITGWYDPAEMQIATVTTFNINKAGTAYFIDKSSYPFTKKRVDVPVLGAIAANFGFSGREIHVFVDDTGAVIQQGTFNFEDLYTKAYIGNFTKNGAGTELAQVKNRGPVTDSIPETTRAFLSIIGVVQAENLFVNSAGLGNMQVDRTGGKLIDMGINSIDNRATGDMVTVAAESPVASIRYRYVNDSNELAFYSDTNVIDPSEVFIKGGTGFENVNANNWSSQRVYYFPARGGEPDTFMVLLGHVEYNNADTALSSIGTAAEDFSKPLALKRAAFLGWIIPRGGASNADSELDVIFVPYNAPFELSGTGAGTSGVSGTTLQVAYNLSSIPQIVTDITRGEVVFQSGTGDDADNVIAVRNNGGGQRFYVRGDGDMQAQRIGIGIDPAELLHINGASNTRALMSGIDKVSMFIESTAGTLTPDLTLNNPTKQWRLINDGADVNKFKIRDESILKDRMTIDSVGATSFVGLETELQSDSAGSNYNLKLKGQNASTGGAIIGLNNADAEGPLEFYTGATKRATFDSNEILLEAEEIKIENSFFTQDLLQITPAGPRDYRYQYSNQIVTPPSSNTIRFNNADPALATQVYIDYVPEDKPGTMKSFLDSVDVGSKAYVVGVDRSNPQWVSFTIDSVTPTVSTYLTYDISNVSKTGSTWTAFSYTTLHITEALGGGGGLTTAVASEFYAEPTGTQTMANGVTIVPNMNNELYDPDGVYDLATDTFTAPANGLYVFTASVKASVSSGGQIEAYMYINGSLQTTASGSIDVAGTMVANVAISIELSASDTVQLRAAQFSGFSGTMQISETFLSGHRIL